MIDPFIKEIQEAFLIESEEMLQKSEGFFLELEKPGDHSDIFDNLKRLAHNFKGSGKAVGFDALAFFSHQFENLLIALSKEEISLNELSIQLLLECNDRLKSDITNLKNNPEIILNHDDLVAQINLMISNPIDNPSEIQNREESITKNTSSVKDPICSSQKSTDDFIRIPMKRIDELLDVFGEQVIYLSALDHYKDNFELHKENLIKTIFHLKKLAFDIQQSTLALRMINLKTLFAKLERAIRDSAKIAGKKIECIIIGSEQELDKVIVDRLSDSLIHMVRNSVDHGIETPEERKKKGKNEIGKITLIAKREGGAFVIEIKDDGQGLDPVRIRMKGIENGLLQKNDCREEKELFELIFENGFSTKEVVSELSGRGVGMNVVKEMILSLKGQY